MLINGKNNANPVHGKGNGESGTGNFVVYFKSGNHPTGGYTSCYGDAYESYQVDGYTKGAFIENVTSTSSNEYPANGAKEI